MSYTKRITVTRVRVRSDGYDVDGRYWGSGTPGLRLYRVDDTHDPHRPPSYYRAPSAADARARYVAANAWRLRNP